jgi:hypothetical protein
VSPLEGSSPAPQAFQLFPLRVAEDRVDLLLLLFANRFGGLLSRGDCLAEGLHLDLPCPGPGAKLLHLRLVGRPPLYRLLADPIESLDLSFVQLELLAQPHDRFHPLAAHRVVWSPTSALPPLPLHLQRNKRRECGQ